MTEPVCGNPLCGRRLGPIVVILSVDPGDERLLFCSAECVIDYLRLILVQRRAMSTGELR